MAKVQKLWILFPTRDEASAAFGFKSGNWVKHPEIDSFIYRLGVIEIHAFVIGVGEKCSSSVRSIFKACEGDSLPKYAILAGYAGACSEKHKNGDLFWVKNVFDEKFELAASKKLPAVLGDSETLKPANIICFNQIATQKKKRLFGEKGLDLVEMEYLSVDRELTKKGVELISVRVVLDEIGDEIPESLAEILQNGKVNFKKMLLWVICNMWFVPKLIRLGIQAKKAQKSLENGLDIMISRLF